MTRSLVSAAGASLALVFLLAGCTSTTPPAGHARLTIAGQTPREILGAQEVARIGRAIPTTFQHDVKRAEAFGRTIYAYDRLARRAGRLIAPGGRSPFSYPAAGWIIERSDKGLRVSFIVKEGTRIGIAARVTRTPDGLESRRLSPPRALSPFQLALWKARRVAYAREFETCSRRYNPVIVPTGVVNTPFIYVFLLPASASPSTIYLGGYHRVIVSPDGNVALERHAFTHGCITLHQKQKDAVARVTEVVSDSPTAPQVYASLRYDLPIRVKTLGNGLSWRIEDGRITLVSKPRPETDDRRGR